MNNTRKNAVERVDVDLTPMLDVVFIMLIFFVVTASFVKESVLSSHSDSPKSHDKSNAPASVITIDKDNRIYMDNREVDKSSVRSLLLDASAEVGVVVRAHQDVQVDTYVAVVNAARQAHRQSIALQVLTP